MIGSNHFEHLLWKIMFAEDFHSVKQILALDANLGDFLEVVWSAVLDSIFYVDVGSDGLSVFDECRIKDDLLILITLFCTIL